MYKVYFQVQNIFSRSYLKSMEENYTTSKMAVMTNIWLDSQPYNSISSKMWKTIYKYCIVAL